jgi:hypothetical protein
LLGNSQGNTGQKQPSVNRLAPVMGCSSPNTEPQRQLELGAFWFEKGVHKQTHWLRRSKLTTPDKNVHTGANGEISISSQFMSY